MTRIICIFPQLGLGGGGKIRAVYRRLNMLAEDPALQPCIIGLRHNIQQRSIFQRLQEIGTIHPRVEFCTLYEAAYLNTPKTSESSDIFTPFWPPDITLPVGRVEITKRAVPNTADGEIEVTRIGERLIKRVQYLGGKPFFELCNFPDNSKLHTFFYDGVIIAHHLYKSNNFVGYDALSQQKYFNEHNLIRAIATRAIPQDSITFVDGITTAYATRDITSPKVLFLHADHRDPSGAPVPRSRNFIENFNGDMIVTATNRHRKLLCQDLNIKHPVSVIPHCVDIDPDTATEESRRHICTVSRLDLEGKPIDQSIRAFAKIRDEIPDVDYLIYGDGRGEKFLNSLIKDLGCQDRVKLMNYTQNPQAVFASSLMSVYPTLTEGFGLSLLESLINGCPVLTFDVDYGPRELIQPGKNGELVHPGDIDGLARMMLKMVHENTHYSKAAREGLERYSPASYASAYGEVLENTVVMAAANRPDKPLRLSSYNTDTWNTDYLRSFFDQQNDIMAQNVHMLDAYIRLLTLLDSQAELLDAFKLKRSMTPENHAPLKRLIWLCHNLGREEECQHYLNEMMRNFPEQYIKFTEAYPIFETKMAVTTTE